jgi:hypothetical protein
MDRKPQQQTLSIRISESLREFLERSRKVIAKDRDGTVSTSDVAKILLESAKDDGLDYRLEVAELGQRPTEVLHAIRKKWDIGQPRSRAEWIFMAQYIQIACEELTGDPLAPGGESYAVLLEALLAVRRLRSDRGGGLDKYYLGNLVDGAVWNDRRLDDDALPNAVFRLITELRAPGNVKKPAHVGRCFYVAVRDEEFHEIVALNSALAPCMNTLFRMAARGHWIREHRPVRLPQDGSLLMGRIPRIETGDLSLGFQPAATDIAFVIGMASANLTYPISGYPKIREFHAILNALVPGTIWTGISFHASAEDENYGGPSKYQLRGDGGIVLGFSEEKWKALKDLFAAAMAEPKLQTILSELSLIYGEL